MGKIQEWISVNLPIIGTRRKPDIGHKCKATDRIFVPTKRPDSLVLLPELDGLVRRACSPDIGQARAGERRHILTSDELFPIDSHNSQDRLSVTLQVIRQLETLPDLGCAVELLLSNLSTNASLPMTYLSHEPEMMVPSEAVCKAQTLCS